MVNSILTSAIFSELVLPFLLVFVLVFAILEKTKILGENKSQINAIIGFIIGLIFVSFGYAVELTTKLLGVMAVIAVILLVFIMLYSFAVGRKEFEMPKQLATTFGILIGIALIITLLVLTGYWDYIINAFSGGEGSSIAMNIFFILMIIAAVAIVLSGNKKAA